MSEQQESTEVRQNDIPTSTRCLAYNLNLLSQDSNTLLFDTIKFVYEDFAQEVDASLRKTFLESIVQEIKTVEQDPAALLVFIHYDEDPEIIRLAVWAYLRHRQSSFDDPFVATQDILSILVNRDVVNRGAVFAALVCFGDRRVCSAARTISESISPAEARKFSIAAATPLHRATAEFCLTWLLDLANRKQYEVLNHVASAVSSMVTSETTRRVQDCQFNFGPYGFVSNQILPEITFTDLVAELMPILDLLAERGIPALDEMIVILKDPFHSTPGRPERRKILTRRKTIERRIIDVTPQIELRMEQRRCDPRRLADHH